MPRQQREQRIRELAYAPWEQEGRPEGQAEHHWQMAEKAVGTTDGAEPGVSIKLDGLSESDGLTAQASLREIAA
jgi:hypothetical protein